MPNGDEKTCHSVREALIINGFWNPNKIYNMPQNLVSSQEVLVLGSWFTTQAK